MRTSNIHLQTKLEELLGSKNVYFQPPSNRVMKYPCIVYNLSSVPSRKADNLNYITNYSYTLTLIDYDPDTTFVDKILSLKCTKFVKHFSTQGLNHYVFELNYKNEKEN